MKAVVMHEFGGPEVLNYEDIETPEVGLDDVLVKVHAVSVNRTLDLVVRKNEYVRTPPLPHILGVDPSGVIEAVGEKVTDRKVGELSGEIVQAWPEYEDCAELARRRKVPLGEVQQAALQAYRSGKRAGGARGGETGSTAGSGVEPDQDR